MRQRGLARVALGGIGAALMIAGCSSTTGTSGGGGAPGADLTGNYDLASLSQAGGAPILPPTATGTLSLVQTSTNHGTYAVNITINVGTPTNVVDNGTYLQKVYPTVDSIYQTSSGALGQQVGTYNFQDNAGSGNDTLVVNVTAQGIPVVTTWSK